MDRHTSLDLQVISHLRDLDHPFNVPPVSPLSYNQDTDCMKHERSFVGSEASVEVPSF